MNAKPTVTAGFRRVLHAPLFALVLAGGAAHADVLVDNFDNYTTRPVVATNWGNAVWHGDPGTVADDGKALNSRTAGSPNTFSAPIFFSSSSTTMTVNGTGKAFKLNETGAAINPALNSVTPAIARLHSITLTLIRPGGGTTDLTTDHYVRFTAWRNINTQALFPGARFICGLTNASPNGVSYPNQSVGPFANISETHPTGVALTTTPTVYLVDLADVSKFRMSQSYNQGAYLNSGIGSIRPTTATLNNINSLSLGWWRFDNDTTTVLGNVDAFIDDIMFVSAPPAINAAGSTVTTSIGELGGSAVVSVPVSLAAMPSHDVTLFPSSSDLTAITVTTTPLVFTPANWNVPQNVTVTGVDDTIHAAARPASLQFTRVTNDLYYMDPSKVPLPSVAFSVQDNGLPVAVSTVKMD